MEFILQLQRQVQPGKTFNGFDTASDRRRGQKCVSRLTMQLFSGAVAIDFSIEEAQFCFRPAEHRFQQRSPGRGNK